MTTQPEALRLAQWIEDDMSCQGDAEIVAELRRLHEENEKLKVQIGFYRSKAESMARIADAAVYQASRDQRNILDILAEDLTALATNTENLPPQQAVAMVVKDDNINGLRFKEIEGRMKWLRNGDLLFTAPQSKGDSKHDVVYEAKIKTKPQLRKDIPDDERGWYCDVAANQTLLLRDATTADLARCRIREPHSTNPADWLCEVFPRGSLVDRRAVKSMHAVRGVFTCAAQAQDDT